ncbi:hypothetical protein ACI77O_13550 [Pseudomonas tritici]|uniref:hypothetical protein n=1 Tax=Pseudomonas tritici TaxID=2745518 RepID=UPI00387B6DE1
MGIDTAGKSIAESVFDQYLKTGFVAVPDGNYGAAVSYPKSTDPDELRRSLHLFFADGSSVGIQHAQVIGFSEAGDTEVVQRCQAARKIAPELFEVELKPVMSGWLLDNIESKVSDLDPDDESCVRNGDVIELVKAVRTLQARQLIV